MCSSASEVKLQSVLSGWIYRGEGNANVVLSIPRTHQIVRFKKVEKPIGLLEWFYEWFMQFFKWDRKRELEIELKCGEFYNRIIVCLLGRAFVDPAVNISTSCKEIQKLDKELMPFRPAQRKHKCLQFGLATLFTDYAFLPGGWNTFGGCGATFAVEIKPKQGWIPSPDRHFQRCQFCLNQHLKLRNGQIQQLSKYCPLDLFSGEHKRMLKALKCLITNPQNNFKIFKDGIWCYGENSPLETFYDVLRECFENSQDSDDILLNEFCNLLIKALSRSRCLTSKSCLRCGGRGDSLMEDTSFWEDDAQSPSDLGEKEGKCAFSDSKLVHGCVLDRILLLQKLNSLGLDKYCDIYEALNRSSEKLDDWTYVEKLLQKTSCNKEWCPKCIIAQNEKFAGNRNTLNQLDLVPYLMAAIANDCSFMVTIRKTNGITDSDDNFIVGTSYGGFLVNIGVFDLYPKPLSTIAKHVKRNVKVQMAYHS